MESAVDPITRSVVQHRLTSLVEEMGEAMLRTSYSQILNSSRDFSIAILDPACRLVAQADHLPVHVGALASAVRAVETRFAGDVAEGDVILLNDPYRGGSHLPDVTAFVPVFDGGRRLLWAVVRAHVSDIGGATHGAYNPGATEIWHEGLRIPPLKLVEAGRTRDDVLDLLCLNVRVSEEFRGDLAAMIGAAHLGERSLHRLFAELGSDTVLAAVEAILDGTESATRRIIASWPDGVYHGEAFLDDDGRARTDIRISATITKTGSDLEVDLTRSDAQTDSFVNSSLANTEAAVTMAIAYLLDPQIPKNDGVLRPLTVKLRQGTIVWADEGRPVTLCTSHPSNEIVEAMVRALSAACPERTMGGWGRRFRISVTGENPRSGRRFIWHMFHARPGGGASSGGDGWPAVGEWHSAGGIKFGSVEVAEVRFPLFFRSHEFRPGSGGDGEHRGGPGAVLDLVVEVPAVLNTAGDGARHGAAGIAGGRDGQPHDYALLSGDTVRPLATKEVGVRVAAGDVIAVRSGGGGGWGDPARRTRAARERDAELGLVEPARAAAP